MKLFPVVVKRVSGGSGPNPADALGPLKITAGDTNATPTENVSLTLAASDTIAAQSDAITGLTIKGLGDSNLVPVDGLGPLRILASDSNAVPTDPFTAVLTATYADSNVVPADTLTTLTIKGLGDTNVTPTESRTLFIRMFGSGATTNDATTGQTIAPANTNGQPDGTFSTVKTGTGTADTTNPVWVRSAALGSLPAGVTVTAATLRLWFKFPGATGAWNDENNAAPFKTYIGYSLDSWATHVVIWQGPAFATLNPPAVDHSSGDFTFDVSGLTSAQLATLSFGVQYGSLVVLVPQASIQVDAWCLELTTTL